MTTAQEYYTGRGSKAGNTFSVKSEPSISNAVGCSHQPIGDTCSFSREASAR